MGGRGSRGGYRRTPVFSWPEPERYSVRASHDKDSGVLFPFLPNETMWRVVSTKIRDYHDLDKPVEFHPVHTFDMELPTLRWVKDGKIHDLYVDGMDTDTFLKKASLQLDLGKGGAVMSKRLSRIMRPTVASKQFPRESVSIQYMTQSDAQAKVWDGAGLISRDMVNRILGDNQLSPERRRKITSDLKKSNRVEFTIMTEKGQDKGHAIVVDDLRDPADKSMRIDFLLPKDTKGQVRLTNADTTFVALNGVHGKSEMRLDIQSLINHHDFFNNEQLLAWQQDETQLYLDAIESGEMQRVVQRMASHMDVDEEGAWPVYQYLADGGDPTQFRSVIRQVMNQRIERLGTNNLEKLRLSVPGGRYYVMPAGVGDAAGRDIEVGRGEIFIDPSTDTAWVNDSDWVRMHDANPTAENAGIADILGGADNDDALWLFGFSDADDKGTQKVLAWRSPNQKGEYVTLRPTADSAALPWREADGRESAYPTMHSGRLAERADFVQKTYTSNIGSDAINPFGSDYSVEAMDRTIDSAARNDGILGMYCNAQMLHEALFGDLPSELPASLEDVIDSAQKTGAPIGMVRQWCIDQSTQLLDDGVAIPQILQGRLAQDGPMRTRRQPKTTRDHWLDELQAGVREQIEEIESARDTYIAAARPSDAFFTNLTDEEMQLGKALNKTFAAAMNAPVHPNVQMQPTLFERASEPYGGGDAIPVRPGESGYQLDYARRQAEDFLAQFKPEMQQGIIRGAMQSLYAEPVVEGKPLKMDTLLWLAGQRQSDGSRRDGIGNVTARTVADVWYENSRRIRQSLNADASE